MSPVKVIVHPFLQRQQLINWVERTETPPEWDGWQVDESTVADLKTWFDQHGDTKWAKFAGEVNSALQSKVVAMLRDHIPDSPLPVKSLADGLINLVQFVVVRYLHLSFDFSTDTSLQKIPAMKRHAYESACQAIEDINAFVDVFRNSPSKFLEESWKDFKGVR